MWIPIGFCLRLLHPCPCPKWWWFPLQFLAQSLVHAQSRQVPQRCLQLCHQSLWQLRATKPLPCLLLPSLVHLPALPARLMEAQPSRLVLVALQALRTHLLFLLNLSFGGGGIGSTQRRQEVGLAQLQLWMSHGLTMHFFYCDLSFRRTRQLYIALYRWFR